MIELIANEVQAIDKMYTHKLEVIVEFNEKVTSFVAQNIVNQALTSYMQKKPCEGQSNEKD